MMSHRLTVAGSLIMANSRSKPPAASAPPAPLPQPGNDQADTTNLSPILSARVLLEVCPPAVKDRDKAYAVLRQSFSCYNSFHAVSVPDLQDASEFKRQRDRVSSEDFAAWLRNITGKPLGLYKVSVSCNRASFKEWLARAEALGCSDVFLVGADSSRKDYGDDSLDVSAAALLAKEHGFRCGGIIIPTRRTQFAARPASVDEMDRVIAKIRDHGLSFFTTQILYESEWTCCFLFDLARRMKAEEIPKIFLTFSPFVCTEDIAFARNTLGVYVPADVERLLCGARSMREASISTLLAAWERISSFARDIGFPPDRLGVNVEYMDSRNPRNVDAAFELAEEFGRILRRR
jgi:5,10-methylenetetrahydrofolate reductase